MAKPSSKPTKKETHRTLTKKTNSQPPQQQQQLPSWAVMKNILTCKHLDTQLTHKPTLMEEKSKSKSKKIKCSGSLCNNTKVMQRPDPPSPETHQRRKSRASSTPSSNSSHESSIKTPISGEIVSTKTIINASCSVKGMPFRRLSGCYECRMVVDPLLAFTRDPSLRSTISTCSHCGEVFMKPENLELHQAVRHAVSELGAEDTSKNIVEIIFQSSWLKKQTPVCQIDRILKVHNTQKTISKFEEYRDSIKSKATKNLPKKHPRCIADGNELLRFHCTTFKCSLGLNGSSNLCNSIPHCNVCALIKNGFKLGPIGEGPTDGSILTTATSGRAHDRANVGHDEKRAMLVCRVIAGRVRKIPEGGGGSSSALEEYDSVAGATGVYSNLDELYVFNTKAILPCFVVIYRGF